jgi:hypothetical protein
MRRILPSILAIVTGTCASWFQNGSAQVTVLRKSSFTAQLKARDKKTVNFFKEFFQDALIFGAVTDTHGEIPLEIVEVLVLPPDSGLTASITRQQIVLETNSRVAGTFTVKVGYRFQPKVLQSSGSGRTQAWVDDGGPQIRYLPVRVGVSLPPFEVVLVEEGKEVRIPLPAPATQPQPAAKASGIANVTVDGDEIAIRGKKSGSLTWDINYKVGDFRFKDPLDIEVVRRREAFVEDLEVKGDKVVLPSSRSPKYKLRRLIAVKDREVCKAEKEPKGLRLTGLREGTTRVTAVALDPDDQRVLAEISVRVRSASGDAADVDPRPAPDAPAKGPAGPGPSSPAAKPATEPEPPPGHSALVSYVKAIDQLEAKVGSFGGIRMKVRVVPDAYRFRMAKGMVEIPPAKLGQSQGIARFQGIYEGCKAMKKRMIIQVTLSLVDPEAFLIFTKSPRTCFNVHQGVLLDYSLTSQPKLDFETWTVHDHSTGAVMREMPLWVGKQAFFTLTTEKPGKGTKVRVIMNGPAVQKNGPDPINTIDARKRQLSIRLWKEIAVQGAVLTFDLDQLKMPKPPPGFEELLNRVEETCDSVQGK